MKKEGKLLTKKQKDEQRAAEMRKQALLASGVVIEGLQQQQTGGSGTAPKKISYGTKKKKTPRTGTSTKESTPISTPSMTTKALTPEPEPLRTEDKPPDINNTEREEEESVPVVDLKDDWDDSSEDEKLTPEPVVQLKGVRFVSPEHPLT